VNAATDIPRIMANPSSAVLLFPGAVLRRRPKITPFAGIRQRR
jgi:hypothetical protein